MMVENEEESSLVAISEYIIKITSTHNSDDEKTHILAIKTKKLFRKRFWEKIAQQMDGLSINSICMLCHNVVMSSRNKYFAIKRQAAIQLLRVLFHCIDKLHDDKGMELSTVYFFKKI